MQYITARWGDPFEDSPQDAAEFVEYVGEELWSCAKFFLFPIVLFWTTVIVETANSITGHGWYWIEDDREGCVASILGLISYGVLIYAVLWGPINILFFPSTLCIYVFAAWLGREAIDFYFDG